MLKAYSIIKNLDKKACEIIRNINTSRGELVDMSELIKYADENKTFNVGLDIDAENYKDILNIKRNNVIITPHIAGVTKEAVERMDVEVANRLVEYIKK